MLSIKDAAPRPTSPHPILNLGFRIFFVGSAVFCVLAMVLWAVILQGIAPYKSSVPMFYWHAHEMIFGYGLAVVAGFLLTAVKTWTSQSMPYGMKLFWVFLPWVLARICQLGSHAIPSHIMTILSLGFDVLFWGQVVFFVTRAVWRAGQKKHIGVVGNLIITLLAHIAYYVGAITGNETLVKGAVYLAFYLIIAMILTIGRRVLPFFIEKGIAVDNHGKPSGQSAPQKNSIVLDWLSVGLLAVFIVCELSGLTRFSALSAVGVAIINAIRLVNWYHRGIWDKSLLWSLYLSFWGLVAGFLLLGVAGFVGQGVNLHSLGVHTLAVSGVGLTTLAMMARVSLGHTGRSIHQPPKGVSVVFGLIGMSLVCRVGLPIIAPAAISTWLLMSQVAWVLAFVGFLVLYTKILASERTDGLFG